ncbi:MAG: hypothetical protein JNL76_05305 [Alphaproteobacteria bacterium]|nr:hypothetical protein [Alphaproteobacteria bacterium]
MSDNQIDRTKEGIQRTILNCRSTADRGSISISAGIIQQNIKNETDIIAGARLSGNVGACVADHYNGNGKTTASSNVKDIPFSLSEAFDQVRAGLPNAIDSTKNAIETGVNFVTAGAVDKLRRRGEETDRRIKNELGF